MDSWENIDPEKVGSQLPSHRVKIHSAPTGIYEGLDFITRYENICEHSDTALVVEHIISHGSELENLISASPMPRSDIQRLVNLFNQTNFTEETLQTTLEVNTIFCYLVKSEFITSELNLLAFITETLDEIEADSDAETCQQNLEDCVSLLRNLLNKFPNQHTSYSNCIILLKTRIESENFFKSIEPNLTNSIIELHTKLTEITREAEDSANTLNYGNSFRSIDIYPSYEEIEHSRTKELRALVREGEYDDVESYLDIHFKLLREDLVYPIRKGLKSLKKLDRNFAANLYTYDHVRIVGISAKKTHGLVYNLTFTPYGVKNIKSYNWKHSGRLRFGSLLCISRKNKKGYPTFKNPFWGVVASQEKKLHRKKQVSVRFKNGFEPEFQFNTDYFMIESREAYLEAYSHILSVLQNTTEDSLPFQDVLLGKTNTCGPPEYIDENALLDFGDLLPESENQVRVIEEWPYCDKLNETQYRALKLAFSSQVALIQGAPGTGKTHVGFSLLKILLQTRKAQSKCDFPNVKLKSSLCDQPFVVLTHSNNVLDQMLELIMTIEVNIVRIGSRSEEEKIKSHSLSKIRECLSFGRRPPREIRNLLQKRKEIKKELSRIKRIIKKHGNELESTAKSGKMSISKEILGVIATKEHFDSLYNAEQSGFAIVLGKNSNMSDAWLKELNKKAKLCDEVVTSQYIGDLENNPFAILATEDLDDSEGNSVDRYLIEERRVEYLELEDEVTVEENDFVEEEISKPEETVNEEMLLKDSDTADNLKLAMQEIGVEFEISPNIPETTNVWTLNQQDREMLHQYWVKKLTHMYNLLLKSYSDLYSAKMADLETINSSIDLFILRKATVIGMTTTGAAKHSELIRKLKPRIVIMDESNGVLEAEVIASLCESVEHLIMIGDPLMIRPSTSVYNLSKQFNLNLSLFERLIINEFRNATLTIQHRMRPQISSIVQLLYPMISNQFSSARYEHVQGVSCNLYFINHDCDEDPLVDDSTSRSNSYEAKFIIEFALYLLVQGYVQDDVTILTFYNAQKLLLQNLMKKRFGHNQFRISTVDGYQGEENDIVILSVVRGNADKNIMSVALSRAKLGFYVIGNEKCLRNAGGKTKYSFWEPVLDRFKELQCFGNIIQLYCVKHATINTVKNVKEFRKVNFVKCFEDCENNKPRNLIRICQRSLPCGHPCLGEVSDICANMKCSFQTTKQLSCGHSITYDCNLSEQAVLSMRCEEKCSSVLDCGHECQGLCFLCFNSKSHVACIEKCSRVLICGHECNVKCHYPLDCPPCYIAVSRSCQHSKTTGVCGEMSALCTEDCLWRCEHFVCTQKCFEVCNRPCCDDGCRQLLTCGHACIGCCGELCLRICRICKPFDENFKIYFGDEKHPYASFVRLEDCDHIFEAFGLDKFVKNYLIGKENAFPKCPKCEVMILNTRRYRHIVNQILIKIENKKREMSAENKQILTRNWRKLRIFLGQNSSFKQILEVLEKTPILQCLSGESTNVNLYILSELLRMLQALFTQDYPLEVWSEDSPLIQFFCSKQLESLLHISPKNTNKNSRKNLNELNKIHRKCLIYTMFKLMKLEGMELWEIKTFNELKYQFESFVTINPNERDKFLAHCEAFLAYLNGKYELSFPNTSYDASFRRDWTPLS